MTVMFDYGCQPGSIGKNETFDFYILLVLGITQKTIKVKKNDWKCSKVVVIGSDKVKRSIVQAKFLSLDNISFFQHHAVRDFILLESL